jgi:hypothetical protein
MEKICNKCEKIKDITEFYKNKSGRDGYTSSCKDCICKRQKQYQQNNHEMYLARQAVIRKKFNEKRLSQYSENKNFPIEKICKKCGNMKAINEFHIRRLSNDGHADICRDCVSLIKKEHYQNNKEQYREKNINQRIKNFEKIMQSKKRTFEKYGKKYRDNNKLRNKKIREEVINHYGGCCAICGTKEKLLLHHGFFNGKEHRKVAGKDIGVYIDILKKGFPDNEGYQILCKSCHVQLHSKLRHEQKT